MSDRGMRRWGLLALLVLGGGCPSDEGPEQPEPHAASTQAPAAVEVSLEPAADPRAVEHGKALIERYECNRCHRIAQVDPPEAEYDCAGCHRQIMAGTFAAEPDELAGWQANLTSLGEVPALHATERFRRGWVSSFLQDSHDLRPGLGPSMPRFEMSVQDAEALAAFLVPSAEPERPSLGDPAAGRTVLETKGCASCHRFTGVPSLAALPPPVQLGPAVMARGQQLAPDLRYTRDRLRPQALLDWLADPGQVKPDAAMPTIPMTDREIADVVAYLLQADLTEFAVTPMPERPAKPEGEVRWADVQERVFAKICRHCHAGPEVVAGGGPGYAGGFGFGARKLDLSSYEGLLAGSLDDDGHRRSLFKPLPDGTPRLVAHLWARHAEEAGAPVEGIRGMPLGLPPLPPEDIVLIETWIEQGRRR